MKFKWLLLSILIWGCDSNPREKNQLELDLDKIEEGRLKEDLKKMEFTNFKIDWEDSTKWESSCEYYPIIPKLDTFARKYYVDFCNGKYRWWDSSKKRAN